MKAEEDRIKDFGRYVLWIAERVDRKKSGKPLMSKKNRRKLIEDLYAKYRKESTPSPPTK